MTLTLHATTSPVVRVRRVAASGFDVVVREGAVRSVRVVPGTHRTSLVLSDDEGARTPLADDVPAAAAASSTRVFAHADGTVTVQASFAPPTLLVRGGRVAMLPEIPGTPGSTRLEPGDRLVALTAAAFEAAPDVLARMLAPDNAACLGTADAARLLRKLLRDAPHAAGVVVTRLPEGTPT